MASEERRWFGTCPRCGQGVRLLKHGNAAQHQRKEATSDGRALLFIRCAGGVAVELTGATAELEAMRLAGEAFARAHGASRGL